MMRLVLAAFAFVLAVPASAFEHQTDPAGQPRAIDIFAEHTGYDLLDTGRFGTPAEPAATEFGAFMVVRMFRTVCVGLEQGKSLDAVMPPGFDAYPESVYIWGEEDPLFRGTVLSTTGSVDQDEAGGHPWITLLPRSDGITCKLEWQLASAPDAEQQKSMARVFNRWFPWELALVRASKPSLSHEPSVIDFREWDRPCKGSWCPTIATYRLADGYIWLETRLTGIVLEDVSK